MNANRERIAFLLRAYISNTITDRELEELSGLVEQSSNDAVLNDAMKMYWDQLQINDQHDIPGDAVFNKIITDNRFTQPSRKGITRRIGKTIAYAASVILIIGTLIFYFASPEKQQQPAVTASNNLIQPGSNKAILKLADGSQIVLNDTAVATIATQGNVSIQQANGKLLYSDNSDVATDAMVNTVETPRGGQYQLVLQDGTKVWLNAASRITYPTAFNGSERRVTITGEVYLEVAHNEKMPFIVEANGEKIQVLGTKFNISAYEDDNFVKTTLVQGSVKVSGSGGQAVLRPDQQAVSSHSSNSLQVKNVDTEQALAWKNGYFMFNNEDIKEVMKLIARWYNVELEFRGDLNGKTFGGTISRFNRLEDLLQNIEYTNAVHFNIQGKKVVVTP